MRETGRRLWITLKAVVLELADQNAYRRHLRFHGVAHSAQEWRRFSDQCWNARAGRARCC
jgi:hypothetical protein